MKKQTKKSVIRSVTPFCPALLRSIRQADAEWSTWIPDDARRPLDGAARGILIWELAWDHIRKALADTDGVECVFLNGTPVMRLTKEGITIKLNRVDSETFRPHNSLETGIGSKQLLLFEADEIVGIVTLAFTTKRTDGLTQLDRVLLTYEMVDGVEVLAYLDGENGLGEQPLPTPGDPAIPPTVRVKAIPSKVSASEQSG